MYWSRDTISMARDSNARIAEERSLPVVVDEA
jgi:hypothetical protein